LVDGIRRSPATAVAAGRHRRQPVGFHRRRVVVGGRIVFVGQLARLKAAI
jgi:hypothetical protein